MKTLTILTLLVALTTTADAQRKAKPHKVVEIDYLARRDSVIQNSSEPNNEYETKKEEIHLRFWNNYKRLTPTYYWYPGQPIKGTA